MADSIHNEELFNEKLKILYPEIAGILHSCVTDEFRRVYLSARLVQKDAIALDIFFLSLDNEYIEPLQQNLSDDIKEILYVNVRVLGIACNKVFEYYKEVYGNDLRAFYFVLEDDGNFKSEFIHKRDLPRKAKPELHRAIFMAMCYIPMVRGGQNWNILTKYLKSKRNKRLHEQDIFTLEHGIDPVPACIIERHVKRSFWE